MKKLFSLLLVLTLSLSFFACALAEAAAPAPTEVAWTLTIVTAAGEVAYTHVEAAALQPVTLQATTRNKNGEEKTASYVGVKLSDVLAFAGVEAFTSLTVAAADGFESEIGQALAMNEDTIVAWEKDGEALTGDQPLQLVPKAGTGNQFVKQFAKVTVNE